MLKHSDYNYQTTIGRLETKIKIAIGGINDIERAAKPLGEKHNIPEQEIDDYLNGIWALQSHLEQK